MSTTDEIHKLALRIAELDSDVQRLRGEFEEHIQIEDEKYKLLQASLNLIQNKIDQMRDEIKEPLDSYKTAKAGMTFLKFISETAKWIGPIFVGLVIAYGPTKDTPAPVKEPTQVERTK